MKYFLLLIGTVALAAGLSAAVLAARGRTVGPGPAATTAGGVVYGLLIAGGGLAALLGGLSA